MGVNEECYKQELRFKLHLIKRCNTILGTSTLTYLNKHVIISIRILFVVIVQTTICDMCGYVNSIRDIFLRYARLVKF